MSRLVMSTAAVVCTGTLAGAAVLGTASGAPPATDPGTSYGALTRPSENGEPTVRHAEQGARYGYSRTLDDGRHAFVGLRSSGEVCVVLQAAASPGGMACGTAGPSKPPLLASSRIVKGSAATTVVGLAPDEVTEVRISTKGQASVVARPINNVFVAAFEDQPTETNVQGIESAPVISVTFVHADGSTSNVA